MDPNNLFHCLSSCINIILGHNLSFFYFYISHWMEADSHSVLDDTLKNCLNSTHSLNVICQ